MSLKIDQSVKVKAGILCPDEPEFDISGWQGRIIDISKDTEGKTIVDISWDSITLKGMPKKYIEQCEVEGLGWESMCLWPSDLEPAKPRDSEYDVYKIKENLALRFGWFGMDDEGKRIQAVINTAEDIEDENDILVAWENHLEQNLKFPFEAVVDDYQNRNSPFRQGDKVKATGMVDFIDEHYGILISCKKGFRKYKFPLVDLAAIDNSSDNAQYIQDYRVWFSNR